MNLPQNIFYCRRLIFSRLTYKRIFAFIFLFLFFSAVILAQKKEPVRVLIIFDVSKSMSAKYKNTTRMNAAKEIAYSLLDTFSRKTNLQVALRVYGSQVEFPPGKCNDTKLVIPFQPNNIAKIKSYISQLKPTGLTPIAFALEQTVNDFTEKDAKNFIIIITDGLEECNGDICKAAKTVWQKGIVLRPFIVGIGLSEEQSKEFECVGNFFNAEETTFTNLNKTIVTQIMNPTTSQVNLLDKNGNPTETNIAMIFYDLKDKLPEYHFIHTLNRMNSPDTLFLDVTRDYSIKIFTIPPVTINKAKHSIGKHNIFAADAIQGELKLQMTSAIMNSEPLCLVRKNGKSESLHYQKFNTKEKYLCGKYDLEVMTLPRLYFEDVDIKPEGKTILIPTNGEVQIISKKKIIGAIMYIKDDKIQEWICNLPSNGTISFRLFLQPGKFLLVYREMDEKLIRYSTKKTFTIKERNFTVLNL